MTWGLIIFANMQYNFLTMEGIPKTLKCVMIIFFMLIYQQISGNIANGQPKKGKW